MSKVYLFKCDNYENSKEAMDKLIASFDILKNIKKGTKVVIKANLVSAMNPNKCATTHPILLKHLTTYLIEKGCYVIIGDSPGGVYTTTYLNHVYKETKMDETGAKLNDNFNTKKVVYEDAKVLKSFEYTKYLDNADIKINFCKLKSHGMMKMSANVKNLFGTIPGTLKPEYHYRFPNHADFANMLIDLNEYFKFDLNITDAIMGMDGNGPTMGNPKKIGLILASQNPYELDYICAKIIGLNIKDVKTIEESINRNLLKIPKISTNENIEKFIIKDFKVNKDVNSIAFYSNKQDIFHKIIAKCSNMIFKTKPYPNKNKCIGCQKCAKICPAKAINMVNGKPKIDRNKCIKCFCCQEFCPVGAMKVKESIIMKILHLKKKN